MSRHARGRAVPLGRLLAPAFLAALACCLLYGLAAGTGAGRALDAAVVRQHPDPTWSATADAADDVNAVMNLATFALAGLLVLAAAVRAGRRADALPAAVLMLTAGPLASGTKRVLGRLDPLGVEHARELGTAFYPSGHAAALMSVCLAAVLLGPPAHIHRRSFVAGACAALLGVSIVLGYSHHPSDVAGGFLVALAVALLVTVRRPPPSSNRPRPGAPALAACALVAASGAAALSAGGGWRPALAVVLVAAAALAVPPLLVRSGRRAPRDAAAARRVS